MCGVMSPLYFKIVKTFLYLNFGSACFRRTVCLRQGQSENGQLSPVVEVYDRSDRMNVDESEASVEAEVALDHNI